MPIPASYLGSRFQVRFRMVSNGGNNCYLDRVRVAPAAPLATTRGNGPAGLLRVYPNPLTAASVLEFTLPTAGPVALRLTDVLGRDAGPPMLTTGRAGRQVLPLLAAGQPLPAPGVYLIELQAPGMRSRVKVFIP